MDKEVRIELTDGSRSYVHMHNFKTNFFSNLFRIKHVNEIQERRASAERAKQASDLRKKGMFVDIYGGVHKINCKGAGGRGNESDGVEKNYSEGILSPSSIPSSSSKHSQGQQGIKRKRRWEKSSDSVVMDDLDDEGKTQGENNEVRGSGKRKKIFRDVNITLNDGGSKPRNRKERRHAQRECSTEVSVRGRSKLLIKGPSPLDCHDKSITTESKQQSDSLAKTHRRNHSGLLHPSWAAKQKLKEKHTEALKIDLNSKPLGKKTLFSDDD